MRARIIATEALSGRSLLKPILVASLLARHFIQTISRVQRKLTDQSPVQALAHAQFKAELEDRHARWLFDRGGPR